MPRTKLYIPPEKPRIYHISHLNNLASMAEHAHIWSDTQRLQKRIVCTNIGIDEIKRRRREELGVGCHSGTKVGEYVPFNFCPRSLMLYILHKGNARNLNYKEGQRPIVHLQADLYETIQWADKQDRKWAFTAINAGTCYIRHYNDLKDLNLINWDAVHTTNFQGKEIQQAKQAEFLVFESLPWSLIKVIGVKDAQIAELVRQTLSQATHIPAILVKPEWYFPESH